MFDKKHADQKRQASAERINGLCLDFATLYEDSPLTGKGDFFEDIDRYLDEPDEFDEKYLAIQQLFKKRPDIEEAYYNYMKEDAHSEPTSPGP